MFYTSCLMYITYAHCVAPVTCAYKRKLKCRMTVIALNWALFSPAYTITT